MVPIDMPHEHQWPRSRRLSRVPQHARNDVPVALDGKSTFTDPANAHGVFGPAEMRHVSLSRCVVRSTTQADARGPVPLSRALASQRLHLPVAADIGGRTEMRPTVQIRLT